MIKIALQVFTSYHNFYYYLYYNKNYYCTFQVFFNLAVFQTFFSDVNTALQVVEEIVIRRALDMPSPSPSSENM